MHAPRIVLALVLASAACTRAIEPEKDRLSPSAAPSTSPSTSASAATARAPAPPTLIGEPFESEGVHPSALFAIEGGLAVASERRVGRIVDGKIEWVGTIPEGREAFGGSTISSVHGRFPDGVDVVYTNKNGRAPEPTYMALTGKGTSHLVGSGGTQARIVGPVVLGESTLLVSWSIESGTEVLSVRGPRLARVPMSAKKAGCKPGEIWGDQFMTDQRAIPASIIGSTPAGSMLWIGHLCEKRAPVAEVWDPAGKARLVELGELVKSADSGSIVPGTGDEAWIVVDGGKTLLHFQDGKFENVPRAGRRIMNAFSAGGRLHTSDGTTIHRRDEAAWTAVAHLPWPPRSFEALTVDDKGTWWGSSYGTGALRFRAIPTVHPRDGCATPLVHLFDVSPGNAKDFTFPDTRKVLSTFPEASQLRLVEFEEEQRRRLGVVPASVEQADALIAHVKANMKDEDPMLVCHAPKQPRQIDLGGKAPAK